MATFGAGVLLVMAFMGVFAGFIAPYGGTTRDAGYVYGPPQMVRFWDQNGFSIRPFVFGTTSRRDPVTLRMLAEPDPDTRRYLRAFVRGDEYRLLGLLRSDIHLFGVDTGMVHLLGTDDLGRDLFSRLMFATWTSLSVGLLGVLLAFVLALVIGGIAGFYGGALDDAIQRFTEVVRVVPAIPLFMGLTASFPQDWSNVQVYFMMTLVFGLLGWTTLARRVRGHILSQRREDYVLAAEISGASPARIIGRHLLPSFTSYIVVDLAITFPYVILSETALSFVGLGLRPPSISWGILLQDAQNVRSIEQAPWLFIPAAFVVLAVLAFTILGDGLRDAADPYQTSD